MKTLILSESETNIGLAAEVIKSGGLCVMPTETVYGLGANGLDAKAVANIFIVKGRPQDNPLILHIDSADMLTPLISDKLSEGAKALINNFWPGPLTLIFHKSTIVPDIVTAGGDTVAIRMPSHPVARALIHKSGVPIAAPSANLSGRPSPTSFKHVEDDMYGRVEVIIDGGNCAVGVESTVLDLCSDPPVILRPGGIGREQIEECLGVSIPDFSAPPSSPTEPVRSPGMKYRHYSPLTPLTAVGGSGEASAYYIASMASAFGSGSICAICFDEYEAYFKKLGIACLVYGGEDDCDRRAELLFYTLREADKLNASHLYIQYSDMLEGRGSAVNNRIFRACGGNVIYPEGNK